MPNGASVGKRESSDQRVQIPSIAPPKTAGSFNGLAGSFEANPTNGSASLSVALPITQNPRGPTPGLTLSYDTNAGSGPFGLGWSLNLGSVRRRTRKGLPRYELDGLDRAFEIRGGEDLVPARTITFEGISRLEQEERERDGQVS